MKDLYACIARLSVVSMFLLPQVAQAQLPRTFNAVGTAFANTPTTSCSTVNCYQLTSTASAQLGAIWDMTQLNLSQSFDITACLNFGTSDAGADGICFVLQQNGTNAIGVSGGAIGYSGIAGASVGVEFDVYDNTLATAGDIADDHIAIDFNGNMAAPAVAAVPIVGAGVNVEDGNFYQVRFLWSAPCRTMNIYVNGVLRTTLTNDIVANVFGNNPNVYWGFTASTGGSTNQQQVCINSFRVGDVVNLGNDTVLCTSTATVPLAAPVGYVSYLWQDGSTNNTLTASAMGTYSVAVTDICGNTFRDSILIRYSNISLYARTTPVACVNGNNGTARVTASNGATPYAYRWSTGATTDIITGLMAGSYCLTVTDAGCQKDTCITVNQLPTPVALVSNDAAICIGDTTQLDVFNGITAIWSPSTGLSNANIVSPLAFPTASTTYNVTAEVASGNLVANGDFTAGNTNFTSVYTFNNTTPDLNAGEYAVLGNPNSIHSIFNACGDHTSGTGNMMIVNSSATANQNIWCQDVEIAPNTDYILAAWVNIPVSVGNFPSLQFAINGTPQGTAFTPIDSVCYWQQFSHRWNSGTNTVASVCIINQNANLTGNDFLLDDIIFSNICTATEDVAITVNPLPVINPSSNSPVCAGNALTLQANGGSSYTWASTNGFASTTQNPSVSNATTAHSGTYSVTVTNANNCTDTASLAVLVDSVTFSYSTTDVLCNSGNTGTATITTGLGSTPFAFAWSNGQTGQTATGLTAGTYTVTVTTASNCALSQTLTISEPSALTLSATTQAVSCNGGNNGQATANAQGGVGGFVYQWSDGQTTATATGLTAGTYTVVVTDANGCTITTSTTVPQPAAMTTIFASNHVLCFGGNTGNSAANVSGGTQPLAYLWSNGQTNLTATGLTAGTYIVTVTDANNCTISASTTITQQSAITVTTATDSVNCLGGNDGSASANASGGFAPYLFTWSNGTNGATANNLTAGIYTVSATDLVGCIITATAVVHQPSSAVIANIINSQNASCNGLANGQAEVNGTGGTPNYTYVWTNGQTNSVATGLAAGNHRVTVTDQRGCTASASVNISQPTALQATASITSNYNGAHVSCTGDNDGTARVIVTGGTGAYGYAWSTAPAQLTAIATGLTAGTYTVTVTDASGCSLTRSVTLQNPTPLQATEQHVNVFCHGQATGQIIVTATPNTGTVGINGYEYAIYGPNQTGNVFSNVNQYFGLVAGTYTVIVRDGNDCEVPVSIQITEPTILTVQTSKTDATCHTSSTGTATATPTGGTSPYRYAWSNGQTSQTATGLTAGSYQVTVTDNNGCDISQSVLINQPTALQASVTPASASCNGSTNGSAAVVATGGTSPYRYRWTNNQTAGTANGMAAGSYQVTVTDAQGCTVVVPFTITEPTGLTVAVAPQHLTCFNGANGQATATPAGGTAPYTYAWLNGQTTATITGLSAGVQRVIITDANGCQAQAQTTLTQPAIVTGSITAQTATRCANSQDGTATAQGAGGTAPFSYRWSNGQTAAIATGLASNTVYTVTISDANGCNTAITTTIPNPSALAINNTTHQDVLCKGDATGRAVVLAIGGTMPYSYMWSNSQTAAVATGLTAGLYSVTVSDANGCATATQISIAEPTQGLSLLVNATPTLCANDANGQAAAIPAGGTPFTGNSYQYRWSNGRTSRDISGLAAGTYTVTVTDANGCSISRTTTVTNGGTVRIQTQALQQPTCGGGAEGRAIVTASSSNGGNVAFLWSNGATSQTVTGLTAGTYTVTATDTTGCAAMDSVVINDGTRVTDQVTIQPISCFGQADGAITMQTTPAAVIYEWNTGFVGVTGALTNLAAGQYTVTITTAQGCRKAFTYTVTQPDSFTVALAQTQTIACYQDATAAIQSTVQGGTQPVTYAWNTGANTGNISQLSAGGYTLLVTDANGCTATAQLAIGEPAQLVLTLDGTETTCSDSRDGMIALSATGGTLNAGLYEYSLDSIRWQTGNLFPNLASGSYTVLVRDANGCTDLDTLTIQPTAPFFIVAATADTTLEYLDTVQLAVTLNDTTQATSVWTLLGANGGVLDTNVYQVIVVPANTGSYHFVAMNQNGCQVDTTIILTVAKPRNANAPKGFTPNGDGTNDTFFIQGDDKIKSVLAFRVYDRWGELVYEATDLQPNDATAGWDGTLKGKPLNSGVFAWYAEIQYNDGFTVVTKGDVTLLR